MKLSNPELDGVILCGGLGTRLKKVTGHKQKCMVEINHRPFLNFLIDYLDSYNIKRIILCTGYKADTIKRYYQKGALQREIIFSQERLPLGTAGAVKNAEHLIESSPFFVLNGDSFCKVNLFNFLNFHKSKNTLASILLVKPESNRDIKDFGMVELDKSKKAIRFSEKTRKASGFINGGIYLFEKEIFSLIPKNKYYSFEYDLFPKLNNNLYGYVTQTILIDIGTPERYRQIRLFV